MTVYAIVNEQGYSEMPETFICEGDTVEYAVEQFADYSMEEFNVEEYEVYQMVKVGTAHVQTVQKLTI